MIGYGSGMDVLPSLPKHRVRVIWIPVPVPVPDPGYFNKAAPGNNVFYRGRAELAKVSGTDGVEVVPSLPQCQARVIQGVRTPDTRWYVHYLTHLEIYICCLLSTHAVGSVLSSCY